MSSAHTSTRHLSVLHERTNTLAQEMMAATSKEAQSAAVLLLADGTAFRGRSCGAAGEAAGEVCFNTSLEGYFETITDPSYAGQILTMTYPQVGNYGISLSDTQTAPGYPLKSDGAARPALRGLVVHDMCAVPSNWRSEVSLPKYLKERGIVAIEGIDTRALVRHLRDFGSQKGILSTIDLDFASLATKLKGVPELVGTNLVKTVSCQESYTYEYGSSMASRAFAVAGPAAASRKVVVYDCGVKRGILDGLINAGCELVVVPWDTPADDVLALCPDGVFLSNGPGDPDAVEATYAQVKELLGKVPIFGICLGHQMIALACGAQMEKLKFGHRGTNQPVMNLVSGRVEITSQNHGFGLIFPSLGELVPELSCGLSEHPTDGDLRFWSSRGIAPVVHNARFGRIRLTHVNLNDGTCEGIQLLDTKAFSVQYHPEASPGPTDAHYLFTAFMRLMADEKSYLDIDIAKDRLAGWVFGSDPKEARHA